MKNTIEQQLKSLLQPLLDVSLIVKGESPPDKPYAELSTVSYTALGIGDEIGQEVNNEGCLIIRGQRRAEIAIHYYGDDVVKQLSNLIDGLKKVSVSEQFQLAQIGVEGSAKLKTEMKEDAEWTPNSETYLSFYIHYSITLNDTVGVIETIRAVHEDGEININLTR